MSSFLDSNMLYRIAAGMNALSFVLASATWDGILLYFVSLMHLSIIVTMLAFTKKPGPARTG